MFIYKLYDCVYRNPKEYAKKKKPTRINEFSKVTDTGSIKITVFLVIAKINWNFKILLMILKNKTFRNKCNKKCVGPLQWKLWKTPEKNLKRSI